MRRENNRKLNRWKDYDYSSNGCYFVTICAQNRISYFGNILDEKMILNDYGKLANYFWMQIPQHYNNVSIDIFQIMPDHIHGIIIIDKSFVGTGHCPVLPSVVLPRNKYGLLSKIINSYKNVCTKTIRRQFPNSEFYWQRSFYDRIIRNEKEYENICYYIKNNPENWKKDRNNLFGEPSIEVQK